MDPKKCEKGHVLMPQQFVIPKKYLTEDWYTKSDNGMICCDLCGEDMDPAKGFYRCEKCDEDYHVDCFNNPDCESDDSKYERQGELFKCIKCDCFTIHKSRDNYCINTECPSRKFV